MLIPKTLGSVSQQDFLTLLAGPVEFTPYGKKRNTVQDKLRVVHT
jgi:hypothetical protein